MIIKLLKKAAQENYLDSLELLYLLFIFFKKYI
jgi:hypothetical protein